MNFVITAGDYNKLMTKVYENRFKKPWTFLPMKMKSQCWNAISKVSTKDHYDHKDGSHFLRYGCQMYKYGYTL